MSLLRRTAICLTLVGGSLASAQPSPMRPPVNGVPTFKVDSTWPKALPPDWTWRRLTEPQSDVIGINADSRDHVWITTISQIAECDPAGALLQTLRRPGNPGQYTTIHGMSLDHKGFLWTTAREAHQLLKLTQTGTVVLAIGVNRKNLGSNDTTTMGRPAEVYVDAQMNEVYVTDGTEHRIWIPRRKTMEVVGRFSHEGHTPGEVGRPHKITVDTKGNIYVAEADPGRRAQRFVFVGWTVP